MLYWRESDTALTTVSSHPLRALPPSQAACRLPTADRRRKPSRPLFDSMLEPRWRPVQVNKSLVNHSVARSSVVMSLSLSFIVVIVIITTYLVCVSRVCAVIIWCLLSIKLVSAACRVSGAGSVCVCVCVCAMFGPSVSHGALTNPLPRVRARTRVPVYPRSPPATRCRDVEMPMACRPCPVLAPGPLMCSHPSFSSVTSAQSVPPCYLPDTLNTPARDPSSATHTATIPAIL